MMSITIRTTMKPADQMPSHVMWRRSHTSHTGVPPVKNRFMTAVKITITNTGLSPRVSALKCTFETRMHASSTAATTP